MHEFDRPEKEGSNIHQWRANVDYKLNNARQRMIRATEVNRVAGLVATTTSTLAGLVGHPEMLIGTVAAITLSLYNERLLKNKIEDNEKEAKSILS